MNPLGIKLALPLNILIINFFNPVKIYEVFKDNLSKIVYLLYVIGQSNKSGTKPYCIEVFATKLFKTMDILLHGFYTMYSNTLKFAAG